MIFLLLSFLFYRSKVYPRRPIAQFHSHSIGCNWVRWPALAARESSRANIWLSRAFGKRQQGKRRLRSLLS